MRTDVIILLLYLLRGVEGPGVNNPSLSLDPSRFPSISLLLHELSSLRLCARDSAVLGLAGEEPICNLRLPDCVTSGSAISSVALPAKSRLSIAFCARVSRISFVKHRQAIGGNMASMIAPTTNLYLQMSAVSAAERAHSHDSLVCSHCTESDRIILSV